MTVDDKFNQVDDIANMLIQGHDDDQLRIKDIATVVKTYEATTRNQMKCDGIQALGISIACSADYDILKVGTKVEDVVEEVGKRFPAGIECQKVFFQHSLQVSQLTVT